MTENCLKSRPIVFNLDGGRSRRRKIKTEEAKNFKDSNARKIARTCRAQFMSIRKILNIELRGVRRVSYSLGVLADEASLLNLLFRIE